jgi:hypothetical protein
MTGVSRSIQTLALSVIFSWPTLRYPLPVWEGEREGGWESINRLSPLAAGPLNGGQRANDRSGAS